MDSQSPRRFRSMDWVGRRPLVRCDNSDRKPQAQTGTCTDRCHCGIRRAFCHSVSSLRSDVQLDRLWRQRLVAGAVVAGSGGHACWAAYCGSALWI